MGTNMSGEELLIEAEALKLEAALRDAYGSKFVLERNGRHGNAKVSIDLRSKDGWPLVWEIVERQGVSSGGGDERNHWVDFLKPYLGDCWGPGIRQTREDWEARRAAWEREAARRRRKYGA